MRGRLLIVSTVLLIVSLVGVITTSALPKEVEQETSLLDYEHQGQFGYLVHQKASYLFGDIPLEPSPESSEIPASPASPPPPPPLSSKTLGPGETIFPKLIDRMDVTFYYKLASDRPLRQVATNVEITAVLEGAGLWSKTFPLLQAEKSGNFNVSFPLDLVGYLKSLETIRAETGASAESYSFSIIANVHTVAKTDFGPINETFSQTLSTTLGEGTLEWNEELEKTQPGSIKETKLVPNPNKYLGLSVSGVRILTAAAAGVFFLFFLFSLVVYVRFKPLELSPLEKEALRVRKKYRERMAEATGQTPIEGEKIISLASMEDLIKVADELAKPIVHQAPSASEESHAYYVLDGATRYQYLVTTKSKEPANDGGRAE